jgi:hypothetical protein
MHKLLNKIPVTAVVAASALAGCSAAHSEVLHVSPEPLANVPGDKQHRTINSAVSRVKPGDVVKIHTGVYREQVYISTSGTAQNPIRFEAAPYAHVVVTGADRLLDWTKEGAAEENIFSAPWPHQLRTWAGKQTYPEDKWHELIGRTEQVFVDSYEMRQVLKREQLARGTFWVDETNKRLFVWPSNNIKLGSSIEGDPPVEASVRPILWEQAGDYVQVRGIRFRYAANQAQGGAANFKGRNAVVEDCIFERTNTVGASFGGTDAVIRRCTFQDNGQLGWGAYKSHRLHMTNSLTRNNNTKNFNRSWEAGGNKIAMARGVIIEKSRFEDNRGVGLWFDIGLENTTVRNCLFANNENVGLFYEIAYGMHAHDNVVIGNGFASYGGAWGASGGISLASAPDCVIERNLVVGNKEGFQLREHLRRTPRIDAPPGTPEVAIWNQNIKVRNNVFAYNRDAQVWAWFETGDARYWPVALQSVMGYKPGTDKGLLDNADDYKAKDRQGVPDDLSLEKLNLQFSNNVLSPSNAGALWNWGLPWFGKIRRYTELNEMRRELNIDKGSVTAPLVFANYHALDLRVPADSPALKMNAYPKGEVPGVRLGIIK